MSAISSYARALAVDSGRAYPIASRRHVHLSDHPLVFVPLTMAGEANAPLAAMIGTDRDDPALLVVAQPRNRDLRFAFAAELADHVLRYIEDRPRQGLETYGKDNRPRYLDAPQMLVPNPAGAAFVRLFGRSTRFRRTDGPYAVSPRVPLFGRWLTFLAERCEHPGSSALVAMTSALGQHWASGQSALEDANLAAQLAWIDPPAGTTGAEAALDAEDPLIWPPAGPAALTGTPGITVDTANRLQGREYDVTVVLHPLSGRRDATAFHLEAGRLCVLTSRHRQACVVVARAGIHELLDAHPSLEPVHLNEPVKFPDGWAANQTVVTHLETHRITT